MKRHVICFSIATSLISVCRVSQAIAPAVGVERGPLLKSIGACLASIDSRSSSMQAHINELKGLTVKVQAANNSNVLKSYKNEFVEIGKEACPKSAGTAQMTPFAAGKLRNRIDPRKTAALTKEMSDEARNLETVYDTINYGWVSDPIQPGSLPPAGMPNASQEALEQEPASYKTWRFSEPPGVPFGANPDNQSIVDRLAHAAASVLGPQYENGIRLITQKTLEVYNSLKYRIDISLKELLPEIWSVGYIESRFNLHVNPSKKNARGPMQVLPGTAAKHGLNAYNTEQSIKAGVEEYIEQRANFNDRKLAAAAYNAGPGAVYKYGGVPPYAETKDYVRQHEALQKKIEQNFDFSLLSPS